MARMAADPTLDVSLRSLAIWALGRQKTDKARRPLLAALADPDVSIRREAAQSLGALGARRATGRLIQVLRADPDSSVREFAAYGLGGLGGPKAIAALREVLANQSEATRVRGMAAETLAMCFAFEAIPDLIAALKDKSPAVRFWSVYALGFLRAEPALSELEHLASSDDALVPGWWSVAKEAVDSIAMIRSDPWGRSKRR